MLRLYNTLTRKKEFFRPIDRKKVGVYTCGPTVYWFQHIGNLRVYFFSDILRRVLTFNGYKIKQIINVTDVGHLTSDSDEGEDKIEMAAVKERKTAKEISDYYLSIFQQDLKKLNIRQPNLWAKATEHIKEQIELIKILEKKGYTYKTSDGIYFDTSKSRNYGKLARLKKEGLEPGKRITMKEKRNATDFALWKFSDKPGKRQQEWNSPWGLGFPGWHIECSAMSMKYLGNAFKNSNFYGQHSRTIDIHTGGIDLIPVHHINEIAQSQAATGKKFVNYWLHSEFLTHKGEKISKSKGGLYTLSELEKLGYKPMHYRYLLLGAHYRSPLDFSLEALGNAKNSYERLKNIIAGFKKENRRNDKYIEKFKKALNDDLNTPKALAVLWELVRDEKATGKINAIKEMDKALGLKLLMAEKITIPEEIKKLVDEREKTRENKEWQKADSLRGQIEAKGYKIEDADKGPVIKLI